MFLVLIDCLKTWFWSSGGRCHSKVCLQGKVALVTGGSSGIGYQIALSLLSRGCRVIVADKIVDEEIKQSMINETKNSNISFEFVDLASFNSVRLLAEKLTKSEEKLDILINNAGIIAGPDTLSEDSLNRVMQVNYFGGFLLTHLLVDLLKRSSGRIIFTSSLACLRHRITLDNIDWENIKTEMDDFGNYCNSKFCVIVASDIFAKKLRTCNITSNAYHPGMVRTSIVENFRTIPLNIFMKLLIAAFQYCFLKPPEEGAQTAIYLAVANEVENITGEYFWETAPTSKPETAGNKELCSKIWEFSERIVKLKEEERLL